jgi:hypothetical protein
LFPNPTNDIVTIYLTNAKYKITIYNQIGVIVQTIQQISGVSQINIADLPIGLFIIKAETEKILLTSKLIKQ